MPKPKHFEKSLHSNLKPQTLFPKPERNSQFQILNFKDRREGQIMTKPTNSFCRRSDKRKDDAFGSINVIVTKRQESKHT